jgi:signal transduction histidine kinase
VPYEPPILLSTLPPNRKQKRLALVVAIVLWGLFLIIFPVGNIQLHRIDSFVPMLAALMFMNDTITAVLLLAQFTVLRTRELIVLATGYLVTAFLATTYALTFPGAFSPSGWLGAGPNSTTWLFIAWNNVIPATLIAFVFVRDTHPPRQVPHRSVCRAILISVIAAACVTIGITWLVTAHHDALPALMQNTTEFSPIWTYLVTPSSAVLCLFIITLLWSRQRSVLDLWLLVVAWTWLLKSILWIVTEHRYSIAWYGNTLFAVSSATFVLIVLLSETITMYGRLSLAAMEKRRQREGRLMTMDAVAASIAHEINQPLAAIVNNGSAALRWLTRASPNVAKASEALQAVVENGHRTNQVIASIRAMFRRDDPIKVCFDINDAIVEALALARDEMKYHSIVVATALDPKLPPVSAPPGWRTTIQAMAVVWIHDPVTFSTWPMKNRRKLRMRSARNTSSSCLVRPASIRPAPPVEIWLRSRIGPTAAPTSLAVWHPVPRRRLARSTSSRRPRRASRPSWAGSPRMWAGRHTG